MSQVTINLNPSLAGRFRRLMSAFGNEYAVERFLSYEEKRLRQEIMGIKADMVQLERKHGMDSSSFYSKFSSGELGDDQDFMLWSGLVELLRDSEEKLRSIQ
jgi:hypothetical protein